MSKIRGVSEFTYRTRDRLHEGDFAPIVRGTRPVRTQHLRVHARDNGLGRSRFGVSASRKLGGAVARNYLKRRAREVFRTTPKLRAAGLDFVLVAQDRRVLDNLHELEAVLVKTVRKCESRSDD